jgi:hypothetical protein
VEQQVPRRMLTRCSTLPAHTNGPKCTRRLAHADAQNVRRKAVRTGPVTAAVDSSGTDLARTNLDARYAVTSTDPRTQMSLNGPAKPTDQKVRGSNPFGRAGQIAYAARDGPGRARGSSMSLIVRPPR